MKMYESHHMDARYTELDDVAETVCARYGTGGGNMPMIVDDMKLFDNKKIGVYEDIGVASTLRAHEAREMHDLIANSRYIVRRLTPTECERLQGYPDGWTDIGEWTDTKGKKHKPADSPRYKALGNSIAIPPWLWVLSRLNEYCEEKTMASLFDGIGGFPLIWEFLNGKGSAVWCSEIEEFPIAVTKLRFPDSED